MSDHVIDITELTRFFAMSEDEYKNRVIDEYDEYTFYAVNNGETVDDGTENYTDLYYGSRKVSDVMIVDKYPKEAVYPNDKLYIVPYYDPNVPALNGQTSPDAVGYDAYFKHNNIVTPLLNANINFNNVGNVLLTWKHDGVDPQSAELVTAQNAGSPVWEPIVPSN